ncbi:MAG TPA: hypothetical protein VLZ30_09340 [Verrucomicrobiae bacterium]|nr:hypothetical protein [Verrucomicrobiae bacterium]
MQFFGSISFLICAAALASPLAFGAQPDRQKADAQVLDHADERCANCFYGVSRYYYCFAADNKVLIAYQKTRVLNWRDDAKNYFTKVHKAWRVWTPEGQTFPLTYDDKHVWVSRPDGKEVRLIQDYSRDIFTNSERCRAAVHSNTTAPSKP